MDNELTITCDREDYSSGLCGSLKVEGFSGSGEAWFNTSAVVDFCNKLALLCGTMEGEAELLGSESKSDGSEYLETFSIRAYVLSSSKVNGIVGVHITIAERPGSDCRYQEILKVSGELQARNHHVAQFAKDLSNLVTGSLNEVCLYGGNSI